MKIIAIFFVTILFVVPCFSQQALLPIFSREISYHGDRAYFNGSPFTGLLVEEKTNKKLGEFKNGYKNGLFTEYYANGKKKSTGNFVNGTKEGEHSEWHNNSILKVIYTYFLGRIIDGEYIIYDNIGKKTNQETYVNGKLISKYPPHQPRLLLIP
ncbi:MAG: hypothetical protein Q8S41_09885 [Lutibacter sp.]|nr:hypothetical protein [Lutibacter sp.]